MIQVLKEKKSSWLVKTSEEKEKKGEYECQYYTITQNMINTTFESNINTVTEEHSSSEST